MGTLTHATQFTLILFSIIFSVSSVPFSKYGRQCSDIGCLSNQVCVMAIDSCSYNQRDGKECGRYPTCKKNTDVSSDGGPGLTLNAAPDNTKYSQQDNANANMPPPVDPNYIFGSHHTTKSPYINSYPGIPANNPYPFYPPLNQPPVVPQAPFSFGQFPQNPYAQRPVVSSTTEPSLWNQFLYNKQPEKRPSSGTTNLQHSMHLIAACSLLTIILRLF